MLDDLAATATCATTHTAPPPPASWLDGIHPDGSAPTSEWKAPCTEELRNRKQQSLRRMPIHMPTKSVALGIKDNVKCVWLA
jgi:hypothetical protein